MQKIIVLFTVAIFLVGCGIKRPVPVNEIEKIDKVGVVSFMGSRMNMTQVGFTIFQNSHEVVDVKNWKIDNYVEKKMVNLISQNTNFTPVTIGERTKIEFPNWDTIDASIDWKVFYDSILQEAKERDISYILTVLPSGYANAPHVKPGYGLHYHSPLLGACPYRQFIVKAYKINDKDEYEELGWQWGFDNGPCILQVDWLSIKEPPLAWVDLYDGYSECQREWIEDGIKHGFDIGLTYALDKLKITSNTYKPTDYVKLPCASNEESTAHFLRNSKEEPVTIGLSSCPKQYNFTQSCSWAIGATQRFKIDNKSASIAATEDGTVIYVDTFSFNTIESLYVAVKKALEAEDIKIIRARKSVGTVSGVMVGFALELDKDGYSAMKKYFVSPSK